MRAVGYGRGCAGAMSWGAIHWRWDVKMGRSAPITTFGGVRAINLGFGYNIISIINMGMGMSGRPLLRTSEQRGELGTSEQTRAPHAHRWTLRCTEPTVDADAISASSLLIFSCKACTLESDVLEFVEFLCRLMSRFIWSICFCLCLSVRFG